MRIYRSTLSVSDVNTAKGDNFTCQVVIGRRAVSGWSEAFILDKQSGSGENYTVVREGHSAFITWRMPLVYWEFSVRTPKDTWLFYIKSPWVYIRYSYRTRVNITQITTSANSVILQFWLHNTAQEDAGRYHCSIPNCQHMLYVQGKPAHSYISAVVNTNNIVLTCETKSSIVPVDHYLRMMYTWKRNGQEVVIGGRFHASGHNLAVTDVKKEDLGNYSCQSTEEGLASNWSDTVDLHMLAKLEVGELTVNGTTCTTVKENQVVVFRCMVEGPPFAAVSLIQESTLVSVNMSRTQQHVYEHAMVVRKCSQLGVYSCRATNVAGESEYGQHTVVLKGTPREQASHASVIIGKTHSLVISITLCSYPGPSKPKLGFTPSGNLKDITDIKKYDLATKNITHNVFEYSFSIHNITDADFGVYKFSVVYNHSSTDFNIPASKITDIPGRSLHLVVGCSVAAIVIVLAIIAAVILSRLNQIRDYWHLRFRSYITPMQNMPEHIDDGEYAEIDDADLSSRGAGSIVQPVVDVPDDNNIPPACSATHRRKGSTWKVRMMIMKR
ncbi:uncharacterized protein LOC124267196 isoform X2 [Haliotis rubra]|uniref:uncharacterized protein LOC124267196 isoform X2 n=1 Tax=Haliotis rubra TaxID=36100 RepID=UPI001EE54455|nr:uncharacterized protein LOC124267196 isoform X2 [Haliotis rubra]